ncbi:hypothetical protein Tco_0273996 [Tanacetum coccineum]
MSSMGELTFYLGLQVTQEDYRIFISQDKYVDEILKKFGFSTVKTASTPMETSKPLMKDENAVDVHLYRYLKGQPKLGLWYPRDSSFDLVAYSDSDYARASLDRKSTSGSLLWTSNLDSESDAGLWAHLADLLQNLDDGRFQYLVAYGMLKLKSFNLLCIGIGSGGSPRRQDTILGDIPAQTSLRVESLKTDLKQTKQIYGVAYTRHIKKVKKLEKIVKSSQARRRARIVVFDDEDDLEDPSKREDVEVSTAEKDVSTAEPTIVQADEELVQRLQAEERKKYTKAEQARMLAELINQRKRYFAAQRAEERRNKPPTQAQQRTYMSNYIKHMGGYTLQQLKSEVDRTVLELAAKSSKRVAEEELDQERSKRQKTGESSETRLKTRDKKLMNFKQEELQSMMIIALGILEDHQSWKIDTKGSDNKMSRDVLMKIFMQVERTKKMKWLEESLSMNQWFNLELGDL